jgi:hypothetical protein
MGDLISYLPHGTSEDYLYWHYGIWSTLIETPYYEATGQKMEKVIAENVPGIMSYLQKAPKTRSASHEWTGKCALSSLSLDLHNE